MTNPTFQEFPKVLKHPQHRHARKIADAVPAHPPESYFATPEQWEAERYPQVTVTNADQEAYYLAKGYEPAGNSNPAAFSTAHASPHVAGRTTSEYPKMVNGVLVQDPNAPKSGPAEYPKWVTPPQGDAVIAQSAEHEAQLRGQWGQVQSSTLGEITGDAEKIARDVKPKKVKKPKRAVSDEFREKMRKLALDRAAEKRAQSGQEQSAA